jgi:hypothetical protein
MRTNGPLLITLSHAGDRLACDTDAVRNLIKCGEIVTATIAGRELVILESLIAFLKRESKRRKAERATATA